MRELPSSILKFRVPDGQTVEQALETAKSLLESRGYVDQYRFDDGTESSFQHFIKDNFEVMYRPHDAVQFELGVIYLSFHETDTDLFGDAGIAEYSALSENFSIHGLQPLNEDAADRANNRRVETPQMFNESQSSPAVKASRQKVLLFQLGMLACYSVIILWPGFSFALKYFDKLSLPDLQKRILFSVATSLVLAPGLFLLPPFGPFLLVPLPFALLFALVTTTNELLIWAGVSFAIMLLIAFLVSYLLRKSNVAVTS